jgi:hypothetical protein
MASPNPFIYIRPGDGVRFRSSGITADFSGVCARNQNQSGFIRFINATTATRWLQTGQKV